MVLEPPVDEPVLLPVEPPMLPPVVAPEELLPPRLPLPMLLPEVPEPMLPELVLPAPLVELPYCFWHLSRSGPVRPTHWLGSVELPDALSDVPLPLVVPPEVLEPRLPLLEPLGLAPLVLGLLPMLEPLEPVVPPADAPVLDEPLAPVLPALVPPALPAPDCAHDALATPTNAAATAAAIVLTITFESPWSVEEVLQGISLQEGCLRRRSFELDGRVCGAPGHCTHDGNWPHTVSWEHHMTDRSRIACLPNGPYYLLNDTQASPVPNLVRSSGEACSTVRGIALCRCGGSKNKPFCDGTHSAIGFSDRKLADSRANKRDTYEGNERGKRITIFDNRAICAHAGYCSEGLKSVFRYGVEPWIDPDGAAVQEIIETIRNCPSGALSYSIDSVEAAPPERPPKVVVTDNGPYAVSGGIELMNVQFGDGASREHYTLCRCGASANKPFCDGSHWRVEFRDP